TMTLRPLAAAVALTSALALSACSSDDPDPVVADPTPSAPSSSVDPTPTEDAAEPWEARGPRGAVAFVAHWTETFNAAFQSGETGDLSGLSSADCEGCTAVIDLIDGTYADGGSIRGDGWTITTSSWSESPRAGDQAVTVTFDQPKQTFIESSGEPSTSAAATSRYAFVLDWRTDGWQISDLRVLS
ncbi:DUF6318 family protein, partial [Nocardioides bruguierae]